MINTKKISAGFSFAWIQSGSEDQHLSLNGCRGQHCGNSQGDVPAEEGGNGLFWKLRKIASAVVQWNVFLWWKQNSIMKVSVSYVTQSFVN